MGNVKIEFLNLQTKKGLSTKFQMSAKIDSRIHCLPFLLERKKT